MAVRLPLRSAKVLAVTVSPSRSGPAYTMRNPNGLAKGGCFSAMARMRS